MKKIKPVIGRVGGKARLAGWVLSHIKQQNFSLYCEPFVGSGAVYFALLNEGIPELVKARGRYFRAVLNDADKEIMNLYKTVRDYPELLAYAIYFTPYSRAEHKACQTRGDGSIESARQYLTDCWQSMQRNIGGGWVSETTTIRSDSGTNKVYDNIKYFSNISANICAVAPHLGQSQAFDPYACLNDVGMAFIEPDVDFRVEWVRRYLVDGWQSFKKELGDVFGIERTDEGNKDSANVFRSVSDRILTATSHLQNTLDDLKKVYLECDDFEKVMRRWDTPETLHYCDAPYYEKENYYAVKFTKDDHLRLCQTAHEMEGQVILSYYPHPEILKLYSENDWHYHFKETVASSAGVTRNSKSKTRPKRTELLLVRKQKTEAKIVNLSGQMSLF